MKHLKMTGQGRPVSINFTLALSLDLALILLLLLQIDQESTDKRTVVFKLYFQRYFLSTSLSCFVAISLPTYTDPRETPVSL